jgi:hypothetical protein
MEIHGQFMIIYVEKKTRIFTLSLQSIATQSHKSRKLDEELTTQDCILTFVVVRKNRSAEKGNLN